MNTIYSYLFNVEISDHPVLAKNSKKALTYGELRILAFLRNPWFQTEEFRKREIVLKDPLNKGVVDYSIMRVMEIFYSFVKDLLDEYSQENLPENGPDILCIKKYMLDSYKKSRI